MISRSARGDTRIFEFGQPKKFCGALIYHLLVWITIFEIWLFLIKYWLPYPQAISCYFTKFSGINRLILPNSFLQNECKIRRNLYLNSITFRKIARYCAKLRESYTSFVKITEKNCGLFFISFRQNDVTTLSTRCRKIETSLSTDFWLLS